MSLHSSEEGLGPQQSPPPATAVGARSRPMRPERPMAAPSPRSRPNRLVPSRPCCRPRMRNPSSTAAAAAAAAAAALSPSPSPSPAPATNDRIRRWPAGNRELLRRALSPPLRRRCPPGLGSRSFRPTPSRLCNMSLD